MIACTAAFSERGKPPVEVSRPADPTSPGPFSRALNLSVIMIIIIIIDYAVVLVRSHFPHPQLCVGDCRDCNKEGLGSNASGGSSPSFPSQEESSCFDSAA